jgi:iterative type I PKS product template protein
MLTDDRKSVYADMAFNAADYVRNEAKLTDTGLSVCRMEVTQPLIVHPSKSEEDLIFRIDATFPSGTKILKLVFSSRQRDSSVANEHASCFVEFGDNILWLDQWCRMAYLITSQIELLRVRPGVHRIYQPMAFRLFSTLVKYDPRFQGMKEVFLDCENHEAVAKVVLSENLADENFFCSPYWIDSLVHISDFVMNGSDQAKNQGFVYITHGWESMRFGETLRPGIEYQAYVRMRPIGPKMVGGDVWIMRDGVVLGLMQTLKFQQVPKVVLGLLLKSDPGRQNVSNSGIAKPSRAVKSESYHVLSPALMDLTSPQDRTMQLTKVTKDIVAEELGLDVLTLNGSDKLSGLGVDSLLSFALVARLRETLGIDIHHSTLQEYDTIDRLVEFLQRLITPAPERHEPNPRLQRLSMPPATHDELVQASIYMSPKADILPKIKSLIAKEMCVAESDLGHHVDLLSLGMDSLMSLMILSTIGETTSLMLPPNFFLDHPTMASIETYVLSDSDSSSASS